MEQRDITTAAADEIDQHADVPADQHARDRRLAGSASIAASPIATEMIRRLCAMPTRIR